MYNVYDENDIKIFGCSSLQAVIEYMKEVDVTTVVAGTGVRINLANGEHVSIGFGCPTSAHEWIIKHVPGELLSILSCDGGYEYNYE